MMLMTILYNQQQTTKIRVNVDNPHNANDLNDPKQLDSTEIPTEETTANFSNILKAQTHRITDVISFLMDKEARKLQ